MTYRYEGEEIFLYMYGTHERCGLKTLSKGGAEGNETDQATLAYYQYVKQLY